MTVANNYHKVTYVGNGSTTSFSFDFPIIGDSSIKVYVSIDDTETELDASNYSVNVSDNGGNVVFKTAPVKGSVVAIIRLTDQTQETPYKTSSGFPAVRVEEAFDKLTMITQEQQEVLDRCLKVVPTNGQKPQELLDEVYARLDSSIEIAESAQKAANDASSAVVRAEVLLEDTTEYVTASKNEINTLKTETINEVEGVSASAIASVTSTSLAAVDSINTAKITAESNIAKIVSNAEGSIEEIAVEAAQREIENAANQAVEIASTNLNAYVDGTVKPSLNSYVNEAKGYRDNALTYSNNAKTSATNAKTSESNALSYKNSASNSASTATSQANIATTKAGEAAVSASRAENATSNKANLNLGNSTAITNCITEIPQDIKLELKDGVLTVKAGSKIYAPNGVGVFDEVVTASDLTTTIKNNGTYLIYKLSGNTINYQALGTASSGSTDSLSDQNWHIWYDTTNNLIKRYGASAQLIDSKCSFPIALVTVSNGAISSIDQVFNGFGYIGSTIFALPGVKGLIPNGRNADGTLKNIEFVNNKVRVSMNFGISRDWFALYQDGTFNRVQSTAFRFDVDKNKFIYIADGSDRRICVCGTTTGDIDTFTPKLPFRAVDYNELKLDLINKANTDLSNVDSNIDYVVESYTDDNGNWYRVYKSGWIEQGGQTNGEATVTLLKAFKDTNYTIVTQKSTTYNTTGMGCDAFSILDKTTTNFKILSGESWKKSWYACGK